MLGLIERENAAILNEALKTLAKVTINAFQEALSNLRIHCPFFLTQNDGTMIRWKENVLPTTCLIMQIVIDYGSLLIQKFHILL